MVLLQRMYDPRKASSREHWNECDEHGMQILNVLRAFHVDQLYLVELVHRHLQHHVMPRTYALASPGRSAVVLSKGSCVCVCVCVW